MKGVPSNPRAAQAAQPGPSSSQESNRTSLPNDVGDTAGSSCGGGEAQARGGQAKVTETSQTIRWTTLTTRQFRRRNGQEVRSSQMGTAVVAWGHRTNTQNGATSAELSQIHDRQARTAGEMAQLHSNGQQTPTTHLSDPKRISMGQVELNNDTNSNVKRTGEIVARMSEPPAKDGRVKIVKTEQAESLGFPTGAELQAP